MGIFKRAKKALPGKSTPADNDDNNLGGKMTALDWEASRIKMIEASERRAWHVAGMAGVLAVLSWVVIVLMMPLKTEKPFVIRVDNLTGAFDIVTTLEDSRIDYDDVIDKYWLARFVRVRETYDWYTLSKDYEEVGLLSSKAVGGVYAAQFSGENALHEKKRNLERTEIEIYSVVPNGRGVATVRFGRKLFSINQGQESLSSISKWVATVEYHYRPINKMKESFRLVNPFGFEVIGYRVDPELVDASSLPVSMPASVPASVSAPAPAAPAPVEPAPVVSIPAPDGADAVQGGAP